MSVSSSRSSDQNKAELLELDSVDADNFKDDDGNTDTSDEDDLDPDRLYLTNITAKISPQQLLPAVRPLLNKNSESKVACVGSINASDSNRIVSSPIRIKLSLKKLPIVNSKTTDATTPVNHAKESNGITTPPARNIIVASNMNQIDSVVTITTPESIEKTVSFVDKATKLSTNTLKKKTMQNVLPIISKTATGTASKRRSFVPSRQVKLPPLTSPGLLLLRPPIPLPLPSKESNKNHYYTPQQVFDVIMTEVGYSYEQRSEHPHRGSSVQRTIDDVFDTNVKLALHPIELVPSDLWNYSVLTTSDSSKKNVLVDSSNTSMTLPQLLCQGLDKSNCEISQAAKQNHNKTFTSEMSEQKRRRLEDAPIQFRDMVPVSLTIPYPESFKQQRRDYVDQVKTRENAIIQWQHAQDDLEVAQEDDENIESSVVKGGESSGVSRLTLSNSVSIPPIPQSPAPPLLHELVTSRSKTQGYDSTDAACYYFAANDQSVYDMEKSQCHPIYLPSGKEGLVAHLDPNCFHISDGRYFGLYTNLIADPNYVGPGAPGLSASSTSVGGLATATTSTTTSTSGLTGGGMTMILSASFHSAAAIPPAGNKDESAVLADKAQSHSDELICEKTDQNENGSIQDSKRYLSNTAGATLKVSAESSKKPKSEKALNVETDNSAKSITNLRKIMEGDDASLVEKFRDCIVKEAIYAFQCGQQMNAPFIGPDGEKYADIGKTFALYGGLKPCDRCKSNKQGVLHCRIRRRHDDPDFDGGVFNTSILKALLDSPPQMMLTK